MRLFEFQGKELFTQVGIAVPESRLVRVCAADGRPIDRSRVLHDLEAAEADMRAVCGGSALLVKAQLDMGGRGKAGLIELCPPGEPVAPAAQRIMGKGYTIPALLLEQAVSIEKELYFSISVEPSSASYLVLVGSEGGVDVEDLAVTRRDTIQRDVIDPFRGLQDFQTRSLAFKLGLSGSSAQKFIHILKQAYQLFVDKDAELLEINPLFISTSGEFVAGDAKVIIDDNSLGKHAEFVRSREQYESDTAFEAACEGIPYLQFDGDISLMCAGAGLTTTVFDIVHDEGGSVANYLEFGGPNYHRAERAMELCLKNRSDVILIVTFGTIARADVMAKGVVSAIGSLKPNRPIVTCIRGTNEEEADAILRSAGLEPLYDMEEAVRQAVRLAAASASTEPSASTSAKSSTSTSPSTSTSTGTAKASSERGGTQ